MKYAIRKTGTNLFLNDKAKFDELALLETQYYGSENLANKFIRSGEEVVAIDLYSVDEVKKLREEVIRLKASRDKIRDEYHQLIQQNTISAIARDIQKIEDARFIEEVEHKLSK